MFQITATTIVAVLEVLLQTCGFIPVAWKLNSRHNSYLIVRIHNSYVIQNVY